MENKPYRVRLKNATHRTGIVNNPSEIKTRAGRGMVFVQFDDNTNHDWKYVDDIDIIPAILDPYKELSNGYISGGENVRRSLLNAKLAGKINNVIYSLETSKTDFYAYQFKPVLRILDSPSKGLLIADEVGLGKTIEAGLIWTELRARFNAKRMLVLCPAMLQGKWKNELEYRFAIDARIFNSNEAVEWVRKSDGSSVNRNGIVLIGSLEGWRSDEDLQNEIEKISALTNSNEQYFFDFIVIDEAHKAKNPNTRTFELVRSLRESSEFCALLSATPIMLGNNDLFSLLRIIDPATYTNQAFFEESLEINRTIVTLRDKILNNQIRDFDIILDTIMRYKCNVDQQNFYNQIFNGRPVNSQTSYQLDDLVSYLEKKKNVSKTNWDKRIQADIAERLDYCNMFSSTINRTRRRDVTEEQRQRTPVDQMHVMSEIERSIYNSITDKIKIHCSQHNQFEGFLLAMPQRQLSSCIPAAINRWVRMYEDKIPEDIVQMSEESSEDFGTESDFVTHSYSSNKGILNNIIFDTPKRYQEYKNYLPYLYENDTKFKVLLEQLVLKFKESPEEKIVLFSYFRNTLDYLSEKLERYNIQSLVMHGGIQGNKYTLVEEFRTNKDIRILLTSEVGSEGIDLQFCSQIINYDIPWNPMKIEQRVGRVDRIGQSSNNIIIWNFVATNTIDEKIYSKLLKRIQKFKEALGDIDDFIGSQLKYMTAELFKGKLTSDEEDELIERTEFAIQTQAIQNEHLQMEAINLIASGDTILEKINNARYFKRWISNKDLLMFIQQFLTSYYPQSHCTQLNENDNGTGQIYANVILDNVAFLDFEKFLKKVEVIPTRFRIKGEVKAIIDNRLSTPPKSQAYEHINQFHPLIRFAIEEQRNKERIHSSVGIKIHRNCLENHSTGIATGLYVFVVRLQEIETTFVNRVLRFLSVSLDQRNILDPDTSEFLISAAANFGKPLSSIEKDNIDFKHISDVAFELVGSIEEEEKTYATLQESRHRDRIVYQENSENEKFYRKKKNLEELIQSSTAAIQRANEGKLKKLIEQHELTLERLKKRNKEFKHEESDVCIGIISVIE